MNLSQITKLQKEHGVDEMQNLIDTGSVWKLEGSMGRYAMNLLERGVCMLPLEDKYDYYGNRIPSRDKLQPGTKGTFQNSKRFWCDFIDGLDEL